MLKKDRSNGFYTLHLVPRDAPKSGLVFPWIPGQLDLIAIPLVLTMGWKNSPPAFSAATKTTDDVCNDRLAKEATPIPHSLDDVVETVAPPHPNPPPQPRPLVASIVVPAMRDPCLPAPGKPLRTVDVFVKNFIGLAQEHLSKLLQKLKYSCCIHHILLCAIDDVFRPNDKTNSHFRQEPVLLKKLRKGDCIWCTVKEILGWVINTMNLTIHLPQRHVERLGKILTSILVQQKQTSVKKWHKVLGKLWSMSLAMPGAQHLFSHIAAGNFQED